MGVLEKLWKDERGQGTTEYMLIIGVIVLAILFAAYKFIPIFQEGVISLANRVKDVLSAGKEGHSNL
ncbi:MAG: class III signal peptide-containing protein [Deltaproteobacteria bacterium]|nr:class III signal peptide-containing protein [Deltaproteobacteria bacterium]